MRSILALLPLLACGETVVEDDVTGILLTARFDVPVARIDVDVLLDAAVTKKGGVDLAEGPAGPRSETIAILLPDDFAGKTVDVRANGSIAGILRIQGTGRAALVLHQLVELTIDLAPPVSPTCGDRAITVGEACDDGNVKDADG